MKLDWKKASILAVFALTVALPSPANAQTSVAETIEALLAQIDTLQTVIAQRTEYSEAGATTEGAQDYYYFSTESESEPMLFGRAAYDLEFKTDADALQLLIVSDCEDDFALFKAGECKRETWISTSERAEWTKTYTVPVAYIGAEEAAETTLSIYACRYNGCMLEDEITVSHKAVKTFADEITIWDRYEWEYETGGNMLHTQEVLLSFPHNDVRKVTLEVTCNDRGLFVRTYDETSVSCNDSETYTVTDFNDVATDEQGDDYNLLLYTMTNDLEDDESGTMLLEFVFYGQNNKRLAEVSHRPTQKEETEEEAE